MPQVRTCEYFEKKTFIFKYQKCDRSGPVELCEKMLEYIKCTTGPDLWIFWEKTFILKGQMHHHDDLGSKCAYMCHLSNKTTRKSVLLSTPQIWLMKVSKKLAWVWAWRLPLSEVVLIKWLPALLLIGWEISVAATSSHWYLSTNQKQHWQSLHTTDCA